MRCVLFREIVSVYGKSRVQLFEMSLIGKSTRPRNVIETSHVADRHGVALHLADGSNFQSLRNVTKWRQWMRLQLWRIRALVTCPPMEMKIFQTITLFGQEPIAYGMWLSDLDATTFRSPCPQFERATGTVIGSEDCLFLNVYTPHSTSQGKSNLLCA